MIFFCLYDRNGKKKQGRQSTHRLYLLTLKRLTVYISSRTIQRCSAQLQAPIRRTCLSDESVEWLGEVVADLGPGAGAVQEENVVIVTLRAGIVRRRAGSDAEPGALAKQLAW